MFTARFYYVSHDNTTITCRAAMKRPLENLEVYNYPHRQTENKPRARESSIVASLVLTEFGKVC